MSLEAELQAYFTKKQHIETGINFPENFRELLAFANENYGDKTAVNFFEQKSIKGVGVQLTFAELHDSVYRLAHGLTLKGVKKGSHVAVMMTNRIEFPITWLALAVLGAVMVPINTSYTGEELDYIINDSDAEYIVTEDKFLTVFDDMTAMPASITAAQIIVASSLENPQDAVFQSWHDVCASGQADFIPDWPLHSTDLLNIQYTSGTTGFPKGCMQTQKYWILLGCVVESMMDYTINNILTDHSFFYMDPQWQLVMALHCGARLNVAGRLSASKFIERIKTYDIEMAWVPRPLLSQAASPEDVNLPLKKLFIGGASAENIVNLQQRFGIKVSNAYGMTEIGPGLIVPEEISDADVLGTCGLMAPFRQCKVVLENGEEAKRNEAGELWIKGDGIFNGYYNKPEANAESFVDGWFRTGDKFIQTEKGYFKIIGRFKDMIRRSSENISAMEVEHVLSLHPLIEQAAVVPIADDYRGEEVKAYILFRNEDKRLSPEQVIAHCQTRLAAFKIPRYIEFVTDFPYTPSKKIAKHKLVANNKNVTGNCWDSKQLN
ncbi:hypothetical protein CMT41_10320 [Colwellia sp. MT41]|uniref:class I adenylate-forming enzyme family protein n=1 Tax=Colwellia sp. MT41 TaxID=58049 RepID=UPI000717A8CF|nr:AMP-binding protein [Colwellia sp. MT41]ALO35067.1 hypothetical protein CMT41_10320 [Colwellia sp. MT41]